MRHVRPATVASGVRRPRDPYRGPRACGLPGQLWDRAIARRSERAARAAVATELPELSADLDACAAGSGLARVLVRASAGDARDPLARRAVVLPARWEPEASARPTMLRVARGPAVQRTARRAVAVLPAPSWALEDTVMDTRPGPRLVLAATCGHRGSRPRRGGACTGPATASSAARAPAAADALAVGRPRRPRRVACRRLNGPASSPRRR